MTTYQEITYPLSHVDVPPGPGYMRLELPAPGPHELPEGCHTGGPWYHPDEPDRVWKPLDVLAYVNAERRHLSREVEALEAAADLQSFPRNWEVIEQNGRRWLVRPFCYQMRPENSFRAEVDQILQLESDLKEYNRRGWGINDRLNVALDPTNDYRPFILDLSNASQLGEHASNQEQFLRWLKWVGFDYLYTLRQAGRNMLWGRKGLMLDPAYDGAYRFAYASVYRPFSFAWAEKVDAHTIPSEDHITTSYGSWPVYTWVISRELLPDDYLKRYQLEFAYEPWR